MREHAPRALTEPRWRRRWLLAIGVFASTFVPSLGTLGYFGCFLLSPIVATLGVMVGIDAVIDVRRTEAEHPGGSLWRCFVAAAIDLGSLLGLTLLLLALGMAWNPNCDPAGGLGFFVMGPLCSGLCGLTVGVLASCSTERSRARAIILGIAPLGAFALLSLWRLYWQPILFAYDPFWGWFAGPIYDESVSIGPTFVRYRAFNALMVTTVWMGLRALVDARLLVQAHLPGGAPNRARLAFAATGVLASLVIEWRSDRYGFTATVESVSESLPATKTTEHFVIHYDPNGRVAREIDALAIEHEFAWTRLAGLLGRQPEAPIHSFVFDDRRQRRREIGAGAVEVSLPWKGHMYLSHRPFPHDVLHHELAHQFMLPFGDPVFGLSMRGLRIDGALIEGVPTALAPRPQDGLDLHDQAAILDRLEKRPNLSDIMGLGFWRNPSSRAYTAAGSFVAWLAENEGGWPKVGELHETGGDFMAVYGTPLSELETRWIGFLRERELREVDVQGQAERFKRASVFERPCAHRVERLLDEALRGQRRRDVDGAVEPLRTLCEIEPNEAQHVLRLSRVLAGFARHEEAARVLAEIDATTTTSTTMSALHEQLGDLALLQGNLAAAEEHYVAAASLPTNEAKRRALAVKLLAARDENLASLVVDYFDAFALDEEDGMGPISRLYHAIEISELPAHGPLGNYLTALQLLPIGLLDEAESRLVIALEHAEMLPSPEIRRAARMALLEVELRRGEFDLARAVLADLLDDPSNRNGHLADLRVWAARIEFFSRAETG